MSRFDLMVSHLEAGAAPRATPTERGGTRTDQLLHLLDFNACLRTADLAKATSLRSRQVWGLLKGRLAAGEVIYSDGLWALNPGFEGPVVAAVRLLQSRGWVCMPPEVH